MNRRWTALCLALCVTACGRSTPTEPTMSSVFGAPARIAEAATYYIATTGSDANTCAQAQNPDSPKLTVSAGVACASAGDTVYLRGGTYTGQANRIKSDQYTVRSGTSWSNPITIAAFSGETVVIKMIVLYSDVAYLVFDRIVIDAKNSGNDEGLVIENGAHHIRFQNGEIRNARRQGVLGMVDSEILNSSIHDNGTDASAGQHGLYVTGDNNLVEGCDIYNNAYYGIQTYDAGGGPDNNIFRNNRIHNNGRIRPSFEIILGSGTGNIASGNQIYGGAGGGIQVQYGPPVNSQIIENTIYGNASDGIFIAADARGTTVSNNRVYGNGGKPIVDLGSNTTLAANQTVARALLNPAIGR